MRRASCVREPWFKYKARRLGLDLSFFTFLQQKYLRSKTVNIDHIYFWRLGSIRSRPLQTQCLRRGGVPSVAFFPECSRVKAPWGLIYKGTDPTGKGSASGIIISNVSAT